VDPDDCLAALEGVRKRYGKITALDGIDLQVGRGELVAVLGPNGAGKTTAIAALLGLSRPDAGRARLFGKEPQDLDARRRVGVMMQVVFLSPELRVVEQIDLVASYYPAPLSPAAAMEMTGIAALAGRPYGKLSGGQKRQVQLALAVCGHPQLLFLETVTEPRAG
jgi:ABC-2 type transport system ATP-binding protein